MKSWLTGQIRFLFRLAPKFSNCIRNKEDESYFVSEKWLGTR